MSNKAILYLRSHQGVISFVEFESAFVLLTVAARVVADGFRRLVNGNKLSGALLTQTASQTARDRHVKMVYMSGLKIKRRNDRRRARMMVLHRNRRMVGSEESNAIGV